MRNYKFKNGMSTKVDDDVYAKMQGIKWNCNRDVRSGNWYVTTQRKVLVGGEYVYRKFGLAEFIIGKPEKGLQIDHINQDSLDNRIENLRFCTRSENLRNRRKMKGCSSKYKGVTKTYKGWRAQIVVNKKNYHLGFYDNEMEAAIAYNNACLDMYGDFASPNMHKELLNLD